jgi:hypothetical protein
MPMSPKAKQPPGPADGLGEHALAGVHHLIAFCLDESWN